MEHCRQKDQSLCRTQAANIEGTWKELHKFSHHRIARPGASQDIPIILKLNIDVGNTLCQKSKFI